MARLSWPRDEQIEAFVEHLCWAHSWYKHLPFDDSARFVVFLAADAGGGFETQKRLHHGWKTTAEYREEYGLIDYAWRLPDDDDWRRDAGGPVEPTEELVALAGFALGPTCSSDQNAVEVICRLWPDEAAFEDAAARAPFERLDELQRCREDAYETLDEEERQAIAGHDLGHPPNADERAALERPRVIEYRAHGRRLIDHYMAMRAPQIARIRDAIGRLQGALAILRDRR
jgi:hypothetical protein